MKKIVILWLILIPFNAVNGNYKANKTALKESDTNIPIKVFNAIRAAYKCNISDFELNKSINKIYSQKDVPKWLFICIAINESRFNPIIKNKKSSALGFFQWTKATAAYYKMNYDSLIFPEYAIKAQLKIFKKGRKIYDSDYKTVAHYRSASKGRLLTDSINDKYYQKLLKIKEKLKL